MFGNYDFEIDNEGILNKYPEIMELRMKICSDEKADIKAYLVEHYINQIMKHNSSLFDNPFPDSGFDLCIPQVTNTETDLLKINFEVKMAAFRITKTSRIPTGYYLYPRSSLSKKHLRLANSVGIIDAGYRGHIIGMFDCKDKIVDVVRFEKIVQICAPTLGPIYVRLVGSEEELSETTIRNTGGFGSTSSIGL